MYTRDTLVLLKHLLESGLAKTAIADQFGISRRLIYQLIATGQLERDLSDDTLPRRRAAAGVAKLAAVTPLIEARLATYPALSAMRLFTECRAAGYGGGYSQLTALVRHFPGVSIFNVGDLLAQVRAVMDKAITAVQSVFAYTLLAGLTVLLAAVQASRDERRYETAILRVLGAGRAQLVRNTVAEFAALGLLAGLLAAGGAALGGWLLARQLELHYHFDGWLWSAGVVGAVATPPLSAGLSMRHATSRRPYGNCAAIGSSKCRS